MKKTMKILALTLALVMALGACGTGGGAETVPNTVGGAMYTEFKTQMEADSAASLEDLAAKLMDSDAAPFDEGMVMPVEPGLLMGFGETEITGFAEAVTFGPVISSIPFIGYLFRLPPDMDHSQFVTLLKDSADPRWNICTEAEETIVEEVGDVVFFLMSPASAEE